MLALVRKGCMSANGGDFSFSLHRDTPVRSNGGSYRFRWSRLRPRRIVQALATGRTAIGHGTARRQRVLEFGLPPLISRWLTGKSGRGRGARFEETAGSLKIRKQTSTLQTSSGRSGSGGDSHSRLAAPPHRSGGWKSQSGQKQTQGAVSETGRSTRRRWVPGRGSESAKIVKGRSTFR